MRERAKERLLVATLGAAFLVGPVGVGFYRLQKLSPVERQAEILYESHGDAIDLMRGGASGCIRSAQIMAANREYSDAQIEVSDAKKLIENGMERCPPENTKAGRKCRAEFSPLRKDLDSTLREIESGIAAEKGTR
ncbi:MAG: hypothetical protein ABSE71_04815 [Candidatus Micrarchaeaceae archaeon]|jgi:hypothetical protein|nr:hypothetical protein [Candidatus Micrarchaeota archaeon]HII10178.1 hypothetical protein [Candidatus Micrarchaeota archaeon]